MVDLAMSIFEFLTKFLVFWHPWHPWVCIRSVCWKWSLKQIEAIPPSVYSRNIYCATEADAEIITTTTTFSTTTPERLFCPPDYHQVGKSCYAIAFFQALGW